MFQTADLPRFFGLSSTLAEGAPVLFGIPSSLGSPHDTSQNGPFFLRHLTRRLTWQCEKPALIDLRNGAAQLKYASDIGDIKPCKDLTELSERIMAVVSDLPKSCTPIVIGGDHSITQPLVRALKANRPQPFKVVCFDHHLDHQYWSRSVDPLFHTNVMTHVSKTVGEGQLIQIGAEPVQTVPEDLVNWYTGQLSAMGRQITLLSSEISQDQTILDAVGKGGNVYISVDVDVLPRHQMRSTAYPAEIGLTLERVVSLIRLIAAHNTIIGADIVEFAADIADRDPEVLADAARAAIILQELLIAASGEFSCGNVPGV